MNSSRPYLLRALCEWIQDNDCTPYIVVSTEVPGVVVPSGYAENGRIVLNVSANAVRELMFDAQAVSFRARFGGREQSVHAPIGAVIAIYARENGEGMVFDLETPAAAPPPPEPEPPRGGPVHLKVVK